MKQNVVERQIMWGDLDSLGIVFYPRYYEWFDASAHLFFEAIGLNLKTLWEKQQIVFGLVETSCRYVRSGRYQQSIRIVTRLEEVTSQTLKLKHAIHDRSDDAPMVYGYEKRICMDVTDPRNIAAITMPEDTHSILQKACEHWCPK